MEHRFLRFVVASFKNSPLMTIVSTLIAAAGFSAQEIVQAFLRHPPEWSQNRWITLGCFLVAVWMLAYVFFWQSEADRADEAKPDISARDAFRWLYRDSSWVARRKHDPKTLVRIGYMVRDAARQGRIHVWGRVQRHQVFGDLAPEASAPLALIAPEFWDNAQFDMISCFVRDNEPSIASSNRTSYMDIKFNKKEIRREWKPAPVILRLSDRQRSRRKPDE
jgi:hypothetical protein